MNECLENIIGLSETTCDCLDPKPTGYNVSASGIWLDQLDGFNIDLAAAADCARDGIWARMERARRNAIFDYKNNLLGCIGTNYKPRIDPLGVQLGESTYQGSLNLSQQYAGLKIYPMQIKGGVMILKRVGIIVNNAVPVTVRVYSNIPSNGNQSTLVFQSPPIPVQTANQIEWATLSTPLELPMWSYQKQIRYYVVLVLDGTFQPKDNKKDCGCNGTSKPYLQWMSVEGTLGNDETNLDTFTQNDSANGLSLDMLIKCRTADIICSNENPLDFTDDGYAMNVAYAIRFRAGARLYEELLSTGKINRFTLLNREYIQAKINEWNKEYMDWINYLCASTDLSRNECLICRSTPTSLIRTHMGVTGEQHNWIHDGGCTNC